MIGGEKNISFHKKKAEVVHSRPEIKTKNNYWNLALKLNNVKITIVDCNKLVCTFLLISILSCINKAMQMTYD